MMLLDFGKQGSPYLHGNSYKLIRHSTSRADIEAGRSHGPYEASGILPLLYTTFNLFLLVLAQFCTIALKDLTR